MPSPGPFMIAPLLLLAPAPGGPAGKVDQLAKAYVDGVRQVNERHARAPGKNAEPELGKLLPRPARAALEEVLKAPDSPALAEALLSCGEAALDLDLSADFERIRARIEKSSPERARKLGIAVSRPRFIARGLDGVTPAYLESFTAVMEAVLATYDEVFGFEEWSKVPGKKLRVRLHLEEKIVRPPHFAPQFPYHSEIDFPVLAGDAFRSPTPDGKFLFYGLCHELGHAIAMWGDLKREDDHHAWSHYTGVAIVERLSETGKDLPFMKGLADVRLRSLSEERSRLKEKKPGLSDRDGVLSLLIALHDRLGPKALGAAMNLLHRQDRRPRINRVRYYSMKDLREALLATVKGNEEKQLVAGLMAEGRR